MNFSLAFDKLGVPLSNRRTVFRYDDTNPAAESQEYIDSIRRDLEWLGWNPEKTTFSSNNFDKLYEFALVLIKKELAYVCDMTKDEIEIQRDLAKRRSKARNTGKNPDIEAPIPSSDVLPGRNRNSSVKVNLELFENMRMGLYEEGSKTLRLKMDFNSANPNMFDLVAYRIRYISHPHVNDDWCIYPSYDFTHGICDSLEHVDYSICTLEFETRREPYYWILKQLDLYRPKVYEMSRLNLQYTVLSKRRLIKLVQMKHVSGWDDPRMPTISGLRRRGFTKQIINTFCNDIGATRASNVVEIDKLHQCCRAHLGTSSRRAMAVLQPIKVTITNYQDLFDKLVQNSTGKSTDPIDNANLPPMVFTVQNSPINPSLGSHTITLTEIIYIDASDFRLIDEPKYYGLAPNKAVGIKYHGGNLYCDHVVQDDNGKILELKCHLDTSEGRNKPKSYLTWVPQNGIPCKVHIYGNLFTVPEPSDRWEEELNENSEIVHHSALIDPSVQDIVDVANVSKWHSNLALQFERIGYFVVDVNTTYNAKTGKGDLVFNRIVSLKEEVFKKKVTEEETLAIMARKEKSKKDKEDKMVRMKIPLEDFFKDAIEFKGKYSKYIDDTGLPTHLADGTELTKSAMKKLNKDRLKHMKALASWKKQKE